MLTNKCSIYDSIMDLPMAHSGCGVMLCPVVSVRPSLHLSVHLSCPYFPSTAHNIKRILFIFGTAIDFSRCMNSIDYGISMFIV